MDVRNRARSDKERLGDVFFTTHAPRRTVHDAHETLEIHATKTNY